MYQSKAGTEAILLMDHRFKTEHILYPCIVILVYTTSLCISYIYVSCFKTFVLLLLILLIQEKIQRKYAALLHLVFSLGM